MAQIATLLFALSLSVFGLFSLQLILQNINIISPHLKSVCLLEPLIFTHYAPFDQFLCGVVIFFQRAMDDYMGLQLTRIILGAFGTVQAIMAIEGSRNGYSRHHLISWFMLWGMLANVYTIAVVSSLMWIPLLVLTSRSFVSRIQNSDNDLSVVDDNTIPVMVSPARSGAILLSLVLMYGIPTFLMVTSFVAERGSWLSLQITSFWQLCPILIQVFYTVFTWILTPLLKDDRVMPLAVDGATSNTTTSLSMPKTSTITAASYSSSTASTTNETSTEVELINRVENANRQRQRVRMAQSKTGVEQLYLIMLVVNMCIYYGSIMQTQMDGVYIKDSIILLATKTLPATGLGEVEINQFFSAHILMLDMAVLTITYALWSLYEDGVLIFLAAVVGVVVVGPGSAIAAYALYREQRTQDPRYLENGGKKTN